MILANGAAAVNRHPRFRSLFISLPNRRIRPVPSNAVFQTSTRLPARFNRLGGAACPLRSTGYLALDVRDWRKADAPGYRCMSKHQRRIGIAPPRFPAPGPLRSWPPRRIAPATSSAPHGPRAAPRPPEARRDKPVPQRRVVRARKARSATPPPDPQRSIPARPSGCSTAESKMTCSSTAMPSITRNRSTPRNVRCCPWIMLQVSHAI